MKRKRRKKLARQWAQFQQEHQLSDADMQVARRMGFPLDKLKEKLADERLDEDVSIADRIHAIHRQWRDNQAARKAAVEAGLIEPPPAKQKKKRKVRHDPAWATAKELCRLNMEDIRKAKQLGLNPRKLIKNIPSPSEPWKAPVKIWIRDLYAKQQRQATLKESPSN